MSNSLLISRGLEQGKRYPLVRAKFQIGRDESNDICVRDVEASRKHCEITREASSFHVRDLGSSNGTYVNGERTKQAVLKTGDQIRIGSTEFTFEQEVKGSQHDSAKTVLSSSVVQVAQLTSAAPEDSVLEGSRLDDDSTYYNLVEDEVEVSRRFVEVGNDLRFLYHASLVTSHRTDISLMLEEILGLILDWIAADRACVMLKNQSGTRFEIEAYKQRSGLPGGSKFQISKTIVSYVRREKVGVLSTEAANDQRWGPQQSILKMKIKEVLCVPIQGRDAILGVIYLDTSYDNQNPYFAGFNEDHLRLLIALAHQTAVAIENEAFYKALLEKERLAVIGQTTAVLAHHVKNTLQGINGGAHLIESGLKTQDLATIENGWQIVNRNQEEISRFVSDMLLIGRSYEPIRELGDLNLAVAEAIGILKSQLDRRGITCEFHGNQQLAEFKFDFPRISTAVFHLINCCLQAERESDAAELTITLTADQSHARVAIFDDGPRIELAEFEAASEPFGGDAHREPYFVGLAVSHKVIAGHDGEISFQNCGERGNRFVIEIPIII